MSMNSVIFAIMIRFCWEVESKLWRGKNKEKILSGETVRTCNNHQVSQQSLLVKRPRGITRVHPLELVTQAHMSCTN